MLTIRKKLVNWTTQKWNVCSSRHTGKSKKITSDREKTHATHISDKDLVSKIQPRIEKKKIYNSNRKKMPKYLNRHFTTDDIQMTNIEKVFKLVSHQENAN